MPTPFDEWSFADAQTALASLLREDGPVVRAFYAGDHWQNGKGWIGPKPDANSPGFQLLMADLRKMFTSRNVIAECVGRHVDGVVGRELKWALTPRRALKNDEKPTPAEQALIDEAEAALTEWWNTRKLGILTQEATAKLLTDDRMVMRVYVPAEKLTQISVQDLLSQDAVGTTTAVVASDLADALAHLYVDVPDPEQCGVIIDPASRREAGVYTQIGADGSEALELVALDTSNPKRPGTTIRTQGVGDAAADTVTLDLGGRLTLHEECRPTFITPQVMEQQRALNLAMSTLARNLVASAFLERIIKNAQMPGVWVDDATVVGGKRFVPGDYEVGAGTTNFLTGIVVDDPVTGRKTLASPDVQFREPSEVRTHVDAIDALYASILGECKQAHVLISQSATPSGRSREEARADYAKSLTSTAERWSMMGAWLIETALALAEAFIRQPGKYTATLRATCEAQIDTGPVDAAEQANILAQKDGGVRSVESAMEALGIVDVDAELARISAQPGANLDLRKTQAEVFGAWITAGLTAEVAGKLSGLSDDDIQIITTAQSDIIPNGVPSPAPGPAPGTAPEPTPPTPPTPAKTAPPARRPPPVLQGA